jgi:DNA repair exonuclease SbcCD ATPase subunit
MSNDSDLKNRKMMEKEDPLMRIEREERERKERNKNLKPLMWALVLIALALGGILAYVWSSKNSLVKDLEIDKQQLTEQIISLQGDYESLSSEYDSVNAQLDSSKEEVAQLVDRIKKTEATNRAKMRQYEKELGTLRSIMRNYVKQIDSLNTLNKKLTVQAANARREAAETAARNAELSEQVEIYKGQAKIGATIKARNVSLVPYGASGKVTDRSSRVTQMVVNLTLSENELAQPGPIRIFARVKDPEGILLMDGTGASFTFDGEAMPATASREIDYNRQDVDVSIYINDTGAFVKGIYTVEVFSEQGRLGKAETMLR